MWPMWTRHVAAVLGGAALAATLSVGEAGTPEPAPVAAPATAPAPRGSGVNSHGLTFGSSADGDPDLVRVLGPTGITGFVYKTDLNGPEATTREEAAAQEQAQHAGRTIPVYDVEGITVIDTFFVGGIDSTN